MGALWEDFFLLAIISQFSEHEQLYKINPQNWALFGWWKAKISQTDKARFSIYPPQPSLLSCDFVIQLRRRIKIDIHPKYLRQTGSILLGFSEVFWWLCQSSLQLMVRQRCRWLGPLRNSYWSTQKVLGKKKIFLLYAGRKKRRSSKWKLKLFSKLKFLTESSFVLWIMIHIAQALKSLLRQKHGTLTFTMDLSVAISIS